MNCTETERWLNDYVDGEVSEETRRSVEEHLGTCLSCHRAFNELRSLLERARRLPTEAALEVLMAADGLEPLLGRAVAAAARRSRELAD